MSNLNCDIAIIQTTQVERVAVRLLPAPGPTGPANGFSLWMQVELEVATLYPNAFKEVIYVLGKISLVNTWDSPALGLKIFTKEFTYNSASRISQVVTTLILTGSKMTKSFSYDALGKILNSTRTYQP